VLINHRRTFGHAIALLGALTFILLAVGRHPAGAAPTTTFPAVGDLDMSMYRWMDDVRAAPITWVFRFLNVLGGGIVTIPIRTVATVALAARRRWRAMSAFVITWVAAEVILTWAKMYFHRDRPPGPLVATVGFSFPSGHAVAAAATAAALVLAFFRPGPTRRRWEWIAIGFSFVMAFSRVYLYAHWFSDVVAGVLLGSGIALLAAAVVTEIRDVVFRRRGLPIPPPGGWMPGDIARTEVSSGTSPRESSPPERGSRQVVPSVPPPDTRRSDPRRD
jgi:membrane-associated phospholipid phosphatase